MIEQAAQETSSRTGDTWVFLEQEGGRLEGVALELLGRGRRIADEAGTRLTGILLGADAAGAAQTALGVGADLLLVGEHPALGVYTTDAYTAVTAALARERRPDIFLFGATPNGCDLAGRLAVQLRTGLTADCTDLELEPATGLLVGQVTGFGGGIFAKIKCSRHRPQMATVRPGVFPAPAPVPAPRGRIERIPVCLSEEMLRVEVLERVLEEQPDLTTAERIVAGGRGTGGNFALLQELAGLIGAEVGATRVAVDAGWIGSEHMIGQTGVVTRPKLAVVCGVSGAMQFTVGVDAAECVVAINSDEEALIFDHADYCIVDDLGKVLPPLIEHVKAMRAA